MSNLDLTCWTEGVSLPVYGRASLTSERVLGGGAVSGLGAVQPIPSTILDIIPTTATGTDVSFGRGHMAGFDRTAVKAPGTSAWRPPDC